MCIATFDCNNPASAGKAAELVKRFISAKSGGSGSSLSMGAKVFPSAGSLLVGIGSDTSTGELMQDSSLLSDTRLGLGKIATQYPLMPILKVGTQQNGDRVRVRVAELCLIFCVYAFALCTGGVFQILRKHVLVGFQIFVYKAS